MDFIFNFKNFPLVSFKNSFCIAFHRWQFTAKFFKLDFHFFEHSNQKLSYMLCLAALVSGALAGLILSSVTSAVFTHVDLPPPVFAFQIIYRINVRPRMIYFFSHWRPRQAPKTSKHLKPPVRVLRFFWAVKISWIQDELTCGSPLLPGSSSPVSAQNQEVVSQSPHSWHVLNSNSRSPRCSKPPRQSGRVLLISLAPRLSWPQSIKCSLSY